MAALVYFLLNQINPASGWEDQLKDLVKNTSQIQLPIVEIMGFPSDWLSRDLWNRNLKLKEKSKISTN